jgi:hypothetical protein
MRETMDDAPIPGARVRGATKHGSLTVDEIAEIQPGMARLMDEVGRRVWVLYYAAKAGNWALARYMEREMEKVLMIAATVRPKYAEDLEAFRREHLPRIDAAIEAREWTAFDAAYRAAVDASNGYHEKYAKGFIRFRVPDRPPDWLDVAPR